MKDIATRGSCGMCMSHHAGPKLRSHLQSSQPLRSDPQFCLAIMHKTSLNTSSILSWRAHTMTVRHSRFLLEALRSSCATMPRAQASSILARSQKSSLDSMMFAVSLVLESSPRSPGSEFPFGGFVKKHLGILSLSTLPNTKQKRVQAP